MTKFIILVLFLAFSVQAVAEALVFYYSREPFKDEPFTHLVLLGINGERTYELMLDRAKIAIEAAERFPQAQIVITGNEKFREVTALKEILLSEGIPAARMILETQSKTTWDNIVLSQKLLPSNANVLIITNEFHQPRALAIARVVGLPAHVYGRDPRKYSIAPFIFFRERAANVKWLFNLLRYRFGL